jgi:hypothetical protein
MCSRICPDVVENKKQCTVRTEKFRKIHRGPAYSLGYGDIMRIGCHDGHTQLNKYPPTDSNAISETTHRHMLIYT